METGSKSSRTGTGGTRPTTYNTNSAFWKRFYKNCSIDEPSDFAKFVSDKFVDGTILDLGCGNGRDTNFFVALGYDAEGKDKCTTGEDACELYGHWDNLYMRWFLHSIPEDVEDDIFRNISFKRCFIEVRSSLDKPNPDHYRRLIDGRTFVQKLVNLGLKIDYYQEGYGLSVMNGEDPHLIRIICSSG